MSQIEAAPVVPEPAAAAAERIANNHYRENDVVYRVGGDGVLELGVVAETSEFASSDDEPEFTSSDDEPEDATELGVKEGHVRVAWHPMGDIGELAVPESSVGLVDRGLEPGGIVRRTVDGKEARRGRCRDVKVVACLQIMGDVDGGTGAKAEDEVVVDVQSDRLEPLQSFVSGATCCLGSWIGTIRQAHSRVLLGFPDGSLCELVDGNADELFDAQERRDHWVSEFCVYSHYKGEHLSGPVSVFRRGDWHNQTGRMSRMMADPSRQNKVVTAIVKEVNTIMMRVQWQCCASAAAASSGRPEGIVLGEDVKRVKMLNAFEPSALMIGDRKFYRLRDRDVVLPLDEWKAMENRRLSNGPDANPSLPPLEAAPEVEVPAKKRRMNFPESAVQTDGLNLSKKHLVVEVLSKRTVATVVWQNGDVSEDVPSTDLDPVTVHDRSDFFCGTFVVRAPGSSTSHADPRVYGVVESVDGSARTCWVNWFMISGGGEEPRALGRMEEPAFDLVEFPGFGYRRGSVVVQVNGNKGDARPVGGHVLEVRVDGKVVVKWVDGSESSCWPQDVPIARLNDPWKDHFVYSNGYWWKGSLHSVPEAIHHLKGLLQYVSSATQKAQVALMELEGAFRGSSMKPSDDEQPMVSRLLDVQEECLKLDSLMGAAFFQVEGLPVLVEEVKKIEKEGAPDEFQVCARLCIAMRYQLSKCQEEAVKRLGDWPSGTEDLAPVAPPELPREERAMPEQKSCKQPDDGSSNDSNPQPEEARGTLSMLESVPSQHRFKHSPYQPTNPKNVKFVRRDVRLMSENLPLGIHVKGYEDRMDLYSAMIEGPANTPYEDGMFFFDIQLSADYPCSPPAFHYHSFTSDRLNPNLYVDGKVCVSLLGTWDGEGSEEWTVGSNLLQVLVSIQGLILVSEPYFNEPGFEGQKGSQEGADNSKMYNEMVLLKMVQGMERLVGNPPVAFGSEVRAQVRRRAENIFERLESWRKASEGQDATANIRHPDFPLLPASRGFWISMDRAVESLKKALLTHKQQQGVAM